MPMRDPRQQTKARKTKEERGVEAENVLAEHTKAVLDNMLEDVVLHDAQDRVVWANRSAVRSAGLTLDQLVGRHCYAVWRNRNKACPGCPVVKARKTGHSDQAETVTPDGRIWLTRGYPVRDKKGRVRNVVEISLDITERKKLEDQLRESDEKHRGLNRFLEDVVDNIPDLVFIKGGDLRYSLVNQAACSFIGKSRGEIVGKTAHDLYSVEMAESVHHTDREVFAKGDIVDAGESEFTGADGIVHVLQTIKAPLRDSNGKISHLVAISRDVTERSKAEKRLRDSEELYRTLFQNSKDAITINTPDGRIIDVNQAWLDLLGYSREEMLELNVEKVYADPADRQRFLEQVNENGFVRDFEVTIRRKDGTERDCLLTLAAWRSSEGKILGHQGILRDITERKKLEDGLRRSEERFRRIFQSSPIPTSVTSLEGPIIDINDAWVRMTGFSREEAIGQSVVELGIFSDADQRNLIVKTLLQGKRLSNIPQTRRTKSGELRHTLNTVELVSLGGELCVLNMMVDITERRQMEEELAR